MTTVILPDSPTRSAKFGHNANSHGARSPPDFVRYLLLSCTGQTKRAAWDHSTPPFLSIPNGCLAGGLLVCCVEIRNNVSTILRILEAWVGHASAGHVFTRRFEILKHHLWCPCDARIRIGVRIIKPFDRPGVPANHAIQ